jgi:hypothetical protein
MRGILKLAVLIASFMVVSPVFAAGGIGCFGSGNCNGGGGQNGGNGGHNGGGQKVWRHHNDGFRFRRPPSNDRHFHRDDRRRPPQTDRNFWNRRRRSDNRDTYDYDRYRQPPIVQQFFQQNSGRNWHRRHRSDDFGDFFAGAAVGGLTLGVLDALRNQPAPPPDNYVQPYDQQLARFPPPPAAPAPAAAPPVIVHNNITINSAPARASIVQEMPDTMQAPPIYRKEVVIGTPSKAITTDTDGNVVTLEEACKAQAGTYYLGDDNLPKCRLPNGG